MVKMHIQILNIHIQRDQNNKNVQVQRMCLDIGIFYLNVILNRHKSN